MQGQVCVITGATSGIGKAAAAALAKQGAEVIVVGRDPGRTEATAAAIQAGGAPPPKVEIADLARLDQVRALAYRPTRPWTASTC
jgi:NAD(P)-dependent dehydrogenase (short-subunit alcohol dehydrogenase family)